MAFINDFGKKISKSSQDAYTKTKLGVKLSEEEKHLNSLYLELGKTFYNWTKENNYSESFNQQVNQIDRQISTMEELSVELDKIKGLMKCPVCNISIPINSSFCIHCGNKIEYPENLCKNCGATLTNNAAFCVVCGAKIVQSTESINVDDSLIKEE